MKAIILAAGAGGRMDGQVKALLGVGGETIIGRLVGQLKSFRVNPVIVVGYRANEIMQHLGMSSVAYIYNARYEDTNSAESLFVAVNALHPEKDFVVVYGDTVFDELTVASIVRSPGTAALIPYDEVGRIVYAVGGQVVIPTTRTTISGLSLWAWAGIARLEVKPVAYDMSEDSAVVVTADLNAIHGKSVNVNTLSDLERARRFCA